MSYARRGQPVPGRAKAAESATVDERRKHERKQSDAEIDLLVLSADLTPIAETHGHARNISKGGVGLITAGAIPAGSDVLLVFRRAGAGAPPLLFGKVCNCVEQESGWFSVGVQFRGMPAALCSPEWMQQAARKLFKAA
jgi:hypothetical protein